MDLKINEISDQKIKKIVGVQMPIEMFNQLKTKADEQFLSVSDIIRSVLFKWLESNRKENK